MKSLGAVMKVKNDFDMTIIPLKPCRSVSVMDATLKS